MQQQDFDVPTTGHLAATQTRRNDPGIIHHQHIVRAQIRPEVVKDLMRQRLSGAVYNQQTGLVASGRRSLRNEFGGDGEVKMLQLHSRIFTRLQ
jgi:hypothetical protein